MTKTSDGIKIIDNLIGNDAELSELCEQETINAHVAQLIYNARTEAGLSQKELAKMINTTQSVISRLEDANYEGHSLSMLGRIANVLNREVKIDLVPIAK
jgi:ribosome-binding protein aMBF1 (putative translation factor)